MSDWTEGYVSGLEYLYGYQPELNPSRLPLAFLNVGLAPPVVETACELGFGQGVSTNLHAAASTTRWFGTDFNSAQTSFARELAAASGAAAVFSDQSFAEFCSRTDLPDFDFIAMHGVWSWISDENRLVIVDFIRRKLKAGGVVYVSYNTQPGQAGFLPMQDLLSRHVESAGGPGQDLLSRIEGALDFAEKLLSVSPLYAGGNPRVADRLKRIRGENRSYVAHEYFNRNWFPTAFSRMTEWLSPAKLEYACSANHYSTVDAWNLSAEQQALLNEISDPGFRETARDLMVNQTFRKDYWVKGARRLTLSKKAESLRNQPVILMLPRGDVSRKVGGALGERVLLDAICEPVLDALADHRPKTLGQIESVLRERGVPLSQVVDVVLTLIKSGGISAVQDDAVVRAAKKQTDKLNAFLCDKARHDGEIGYLASPSILTGLEVGRVAQLFLYAMRHGKTQPAELAAYVLQVFQGQGIAIVRDGKPLESTPEKLEALASQAKIFIDGQLPILSALQVI
jgi:SAM-dependent methyltransferase